MICKFSIQTIKSLVSPLEFYLCSQIRRIAQPEMSEYKLLTHCLNVSPNIESPVRCHRVGYIPLHQLHKGDIRHLPILSELYVLSSFPYSWKFQMYWDKVKWSMVQSLNDIVVDLISSSRSACKFYVKRIFHVIEYALFSWQSVSFVCL